MNKPKSQRPFSSPNEKHMGSAESSSLSTLSFMGNFSFRGVAMTNGIFSFLPLPFDCEDTLMAHGGVV